MNKKQDINMSRKPIDLEMKYKLAELNPAIEDVEVLKNKVVVDSSLSTTSTHPVENRVITKNLNNKVSKEQGKGLSTNDFTDEYKNNIQNAYDNAQQALNATTYITNTISVLSNSVSQFSKDVDNFKTEISDFEKVTNNSLKEFESKLNIIIDDVINTKYKIGINDGHLYIQEFVEEATI